MMTRVMMTGKRVERDGSLVLEKGVEEGREGGG